MVNSNDKDDLALFALSQKLFVRGCYQGVGVIKLLVGNEPADPDTVCPPVTECVPPLMWWATHSVPASWTTCRRLNSPILTLQKCNFSGRRRSSISSPRLPSSQRWTLSTLSNLPSFHLAPLARPNKTTTATFPPSPPPSLTHRPVLSDLHHHALSALPLRAPSAPIPLGLSVLIHRASSAGRSRATAPCPATITR